MDFWKSTFLKIEPYFFYILSIFIWYWGIQFPFFWDSTSQSAQALWYYHHDFKSIISPTILDTGHPPLWTLYLGYCWKLFGKSLIVSHLAVLPFLFLTVFSINLIVENWIKEPKYQFWTKILIFFQATFLVQITSLYFELPLICFFLLALCQILNPQKSLLSILWQSIFLIFLILISMRGWVLLIILLLIDIYETFKNRKSINVFPYLTSILLLSLYLKYHYDITGWLFTSPEYQAARGLASVDQIIKNFFIFGFQMLDQGRILLILLFIWYVIAKIRKLRLNIIQDQLLVIISIVLILFMSSSIFFTNSFGARYFNLFFILITIWLVKELINQQKYMLKIIIILITFLSAHFWKYPYNMKQSWDGTYVFLPYFELKSQLDQDLKDLNIDKKEVAAYFPLQVSDEIYQLKNDTSHFIDLDQIKFIDTKYIVASNVGNRSDIEYLQFLSTTELIKKYQKGNIWFELRKNMK